MYNYYIKNFVIVKIKDLEFIMIKRNENFVLIFISALESFRLIDALSF